ncbi:MAG: SLC13 family permease [Pseudomonadota bacterium]|nr:cyclic nucleotide-binding domain-containing protein [Alphaproteobacteria bacterium]
MSSSSAFNTLDFLKPLQRARLATVAVEEIVLAGETIFKEGASSEFFYVLLSGKVELKNKIRKELIHRDNFFGTEVPCGIEQYLFTAVAKSKCKLLKIKKDILYDTIDHLDLQKFQKRFLQNFVGAFYPKNFLVFKKDSVERLFAQADRFWIDCIGWVLAAIVPFITHWLLSKTTMNNQSMIFLSVLSAWSVIASFRLMSDYVATMATIFLLIGGGVVKTKVILAGFSSSNFIVALSLLGLSSVLVSSGVIYRILLKILKFCSPSYWRDNLILLSIGGWLTLGVPAFLLRMDMMKIFYQDTLRIRNIAEGTNQARAMGFSAYCGAGIFSQSILSASMMHFVLLGLFWGQYASRFDWWGWFFASLGSLAVLLSGYLFILFTFFGRNVKTAKPSKNSPYLDDILKILGPTSSTEKASLICMIGAIISLATVSLHDIEPDVICLLILLFLFTFQFMNDKGFQTRIKWDFLIFMCGLSGIAFAASDVGLIGWLEDNTKWMGEYLNHHFFELTTFMILFTLAVQLILPRDVNINILSIMFIPLFQKNGVSPWVAVFIVNTIGRIWFLEYQEPEYTVFLRQSKNFSAKAAKSLKRARMYLNIFYVISIYVGIFYWKWIGVLQ